ncbi:STAS domain-containing protein [Streptomyces vietnamensis]|uniref:STAS domain-containing protein n=1 Tax=Streptomyces vietnamensis TaxID=362257 RepID=UPI00069744A9|nr:STAS domain-containing protein [Streptomyces vietnamensis]
MRNDDRTGCEGQYAPAVGGHLYSGPDGTSVYRQATRHDGTAHLQATGEFDMDSADCLRRALADARNDGATLIRLDLTSVAFGDSSFLHVLVRAHRSPGTLILTGPLPHHLRHLFVLTDTTHLFHFEP